VACWNLGVLYTDCSAPIDATKTRIVPGVDGVVALSAGNSHVCALRQDGTVLCWGDSAENKAASAPTLVPMLSQVDQIASGHAHNCAHTIYGDVACWGDNSKDQLGTQLLGIEASSTPIVVPLVNDVTSLALNRSRSCVVEQDGNVTCWGERASVPVPVKGISSVTQLAANAFYLCALKRDGKVMCWGQVPGGPSLTAPTSVNNLSGVVEIAAGPGHACARKSSGTVECWGANTFHQLGTGIQRSLLDTARGEVFGLTDAEELSLGAAHSCARSRSQGVVCWGSAFGSSTPIRVEGL
jgi:alpha-tubulin suppressor-like RCC1 family protein